MAAAFSLGTSGACAQTNFTGPLSGSWFSSGYWSNGIPNGGTVTYVNLAGPTVTSGTGNTASLYIGNDLSGRLYVENDGVVNSTFSYLGYSSGSYGAAVVSGNGEWSSSQDLYVGYSGDGLLRARDSGSVSVAKSLYVGHSAEGEMTVVGAGVSSATGSLGHSVGSTGTATLSGGGGFFDFGIWDISGSLNVGNSGTGNLNVQVGGAVTNTDGFIGQWNGASGTATVEGWWLNDYLLEVGVRGAGTLKVQGASGLVRSREAYIGYLGNSIGIATVTGNAKWESEYLFVGGGRLRILPFGTGTLNVTDSGTLEVTNMLKTWEAGTINLDGGSITTGNLDVSSGTLNIQGGGHASVSGSLVIQRILDVPALNFTIAPLANPFIDVTADATLAGTLSVGLEPGFFLTDGDTFTLIDIGGTQLGSFDNHAQGDLLGTYNGVDLYLSYTGGDGNDVIVYAVSEIVRLDYSAWASLYPGDDLINPDADLDGDGVTNNKERLFGLEPNESASRNPYTIPLDAATGTFSFRRRDDALTGFITRIETSPDFIRWAVDDDAELVIGTPDAIGVETVEVTLSPDLLSASKLFIRVNQDR